MAGPKSVQTRQMGNFNMAAAADRTQAFWEIYPDGKIVTKKKRESSENNLLVYRTYIWKDKKNWLEALQAIPAGTDPATAEEILLMSADVTGTAKQGQEKEAKKDFEKLETISVGRALGILGFNKDGTIASTEELDEYHELKNKKLEQDIKEGIDFLNTSTTLAELQDNWVKLDGEVKQMPEVIELKDKLKDKFTKKEAVKAKKVA